MNHTPQWPLLNNARPAADAQRPDAQVTESERDRAERLLHQALRDGRLNVAEFERRFTVAMNAAKVSQLRTAVADMPAPVQRAVTSVHDYYRTATGQPQHNAVALAATRPSAQADKQQNGIAALAYASGMLAWILGPFLCYATARPGSFARIQAAKAFNFHLTTGIMLVVANIVLGVLGLGGLGALLTLGWLGLSIAGAIKAGNGEDWENPVSARWNIEALRTDGR